MMDRSKAQQPCQKSVVGDSNKRVVKIAGFHGEESLAGVFGTC
jgi:hypothetical protein